MVGSHIGVARVERSDTRENVLGIALLNPGYGVRSARLAEVIRQPLEQRIATL